MSAAAPEAPARPIGPGSRLGPYEVLALLGAGGMGEVFRARDLRLGREVAIKLLPPAMAAHPARVRRFEQEARASSALNHPHILTVYDVGTADSRLFIVMELVEGKTLRDLLGEGPLLLRKALDLAVQMASGLAKAHAAGIVHRDLKPENVMVTRDGFVKVLDFGLAKLAGGDEDSASAGPPASITHTDAVLGTLGYMSPEQARGDPADFRSDQFSFGAVLYEMLSARRAFFRPTPVATLGAILHDEPEPLAHAVPGVPAELAWIVERCLAKDPERRYAGTRDLVRDLERVRDQAIRTESGPVAGLPARGRSGGTALLAGAAAIVTVLLAWQLAARRPPSTANTGPGARSLAVLPFRNLTGTPADDYFAAGITEAIGAELSKAHGLMVISASSVVPDKTLALDPQRAGRELGATHLLEGSVQRADDRMRITARLTEVATGRQVWSDRYDRHSQDVFALQDDVARSVGAALRVSLRGSSGHGPSPPTSSLAAYDAYLRGRFHFNKLYGMPSGQAEPDGQEARAWFEKAVALDPRFAEAHAALGETYASLLFYVEARKEYQEKAYVSIERALALDPDLAEAYAARALLAWTLANGFPHETAAADLRRALELNPNLADARWLLGRIYAHVGLLEASLAQFEIAQRLAPDQERSLNRMGMVYGYQGHYEEALAAFTKISPEKLDDETVSPLLHLGRLEEAKQAAETCLRKHPDDPVCTSAYALVLARAGDITRAEQYAERAIQADRGLSHYHHTEYAIGSAYALIGNKAAAIQWLERAAAHGLPCYPLFRDDPNLAGLRGDPEYQAFMTRLRSQWEGYRRELLPPPA
jgi:TolB-like protein/tetratricopeptide (TPR) repeat protein/predicted Ser/Thr protein kinase